MTATAEPTIPATAGPLPVVLLGLGEVSKLVTVAQQTVYRWRTRQNLPDPLLVVSGTPLWDEDTILAWLETRNLKIDKRALTRIRKAQGH